VTVAGGGLAGLTAALRLAERGYRVTLYEEKSMLGGNVASRRIAGGTFIDVYPHMYLGWYHNFWRLLEDAGVDREESFARFSSVKQLARGGFPRFTTLTSGYSIAHLLQNVYSGVGPPADMFLFGYASLDLLAERLNPTVRLQEMSVSGFLNARPYITKRAVDAYESYITNVWAIPSYLASAEDYQTYLAYCFAEPDSLFWLTRGPALHQMIDRLASALRQAGVRIECNVHVTSVTRAGGRVSEIGLRRTRFDPRTYKWVGTGESWTVKVDELLLAVPAPTLARLARRGSAGQRIVDAEPDLAELSRLGTRQVPIVHLYFDSKLNPRFAEVPAEPVGLQGSRLGLAFTNLSKTWDSVPACQGRTVLALSCSDAYALPGPRPPDDGHEMLEELSQYLHFDPGAAWGESPDIDWALTRYHENLDAQLFLNEVGVDVWRPGASCRRLWNLSFAGDLCQNPIGMTTVEAAVASGLEAAGAIVQRRGVGDEVELIEPDTLPDSLYVWLRYAWGPYALAAKTWSMGGPPPEGNPPAGPAGEQSVWPGRDRRGPGDELSLLHYLLTPGLQPWRQRRDS
jgi:hypothetical protein